MKTYELLRGDTWNPTLRVYSDKLKTQPLDCSDYGGKCYVKEELDAEAETKVELDVTWTDQANGIGTVAMSHADSLKLRIHEYIYEFKIFDDTSSAATEFQKTVDQGILDVVEVLKTTGLT
jgi:hypothetical protein